MAKQLFIEKCDCALSLGKLSLQEAATLDVQENEIVLRNVPLTILDRKNQNGRRYMTEDMRKALKDAEFEIKNRSLLGQSDEHPEGTFVAPSHASHTILDAYIKENVEVYVEGKTERWNMLFADVLILDTEEGRNLFALAKAGCSIGTSIRSLGDMDGDKVVNIEWKGYDHVSLPSSGTNLFMPITESVSLKTTSRRGLAEAAGEDREEWYVIAVKDTREGEEVSLGYIKDKDAPLESSYDDDINEALRFGARETAEMVAATLDQTYSYSVEEILYDHETDGYKLKITEISEKVNVTAYNIEWDAPEDVITEWLGSEVMIDFLMDEFADDLDEKTRYGKVQAKLVEKTGYTPTKFEYRVGIKEDEDAALSQKDKSVTISLSNGTEVTKTYDTKYQADVAAAGIASGKISGDELLKETRMKEAFEVSTSTETSVQTDETALEKAAELLSPEAPATATEVTIEKDSEEGTVTVSSETLDTVDTLQQALTMVGQANAQPNTVVTSSNIEPIEPEDLGESAVKEADENEDAAADENAGIIDIAIIVPEVAKLNAEYHYNKISEEDYRDALNNLGVANIADEVVNSLNSNDNEPESKFLNYNEIETVIAANYDVVNANLNKNTRIEEAKQMNLKTESEAIVTNGTVVTDSPEARGVPSANNGTQAEKNLNKAVANAIEGKADDEGEYIDNVENMINTNVAARNKAADDVINVSNRTYEENSNVQSELLKQLAKAEALLKSKSRRVTEMKRLAKEALKVQKDKLTKQAKLERERMIDTVAAKIEAIVEGCEKIEKELEDEACRAKKNLKMTESLTRSSMKLNKIMIEHIKAQKKAPSFTMKESAARQLARKFA